MIRLMLSLMVFYIIASPALAETVRYCTDTAVRGFQWKDGVPKSARFERGRFTVKIISKTMRSMKLPGHEHVSTYRCEDFPGGGVLACLQVGVPVLNPIMFKGNRFERVVNFSSHVGGDPDLYVAYGTCTKF